MGSGSSSFEENLQTKTQTITGYHNQINASVTQIRNKANFLLKTIRDRGYNDKQLICSKIMWQNYDELLNFFPIVTTSDNIRYKSGVTIPIAAETPELKQSKLQTCLDISVLYNKKINLINNILAELPNCVNMETNIFNGLTLRLQSENANNEKWLNIYKKLENFNKEIKSKYDLINKQLESIRLAKSITQIDGISKTTNAILANTNSTCKNYENDLIQYSSKSDNRPTKALPTVPLSQGSLPPPSYPAPLPPATDLIE